MTTPTGDEPTVPDHPTVPAQPTGFEPRHAAPAEPAGPTLPAQAQTPAQGAFGAPAPAPFRQQSFGAPEYLGSTLLEAPAPRRRSKKGWIAGGVAALVLVGAGSAGAVVVGSGLLGGGGTYPAERLPATSIGYFEVDLNPGAVQKLDAVKFLRKFPDLKGKFAADRDLRRSLWDLASVSNNKIGQLDYKTDIEPWLGDRVGVGVLAPDSPSGDPVVIAALQVKDEKKARAGIAKLEKAESASDPIFVAYSSGYAIISDTQAHADSAVAATKKGSLAKDPQFKADVANLGQRGITSGWVDLARLAKAIPNQGISAAQMSTLSGQLKGTFAYSVRFDGDDLEFLAKGRGGDPTMTVSNPSSTNALKTLPASSVAALSFADGNRRIENAWKQLPKLMSSLGGLGGGTPGQTDEMVKGFERATGLKLPADLAVLFGSDFAVGVDSEGLDKNVPNVGVRVTTDGARAKTVIDKLLQTLGGMMGNDFPLVVKTTGDGYVAASNDAYAAKLAKPGTLGDSAAFKAAVPDLAGAQIAGYFDVDTIAKAVADRTGTAQGNSGVLDAEVIDAVGFTATANDKGESTMRLRIITR